MDVVTALEARAAEVLRRQRMLNPVPVADPTRPLHDFDLYKGEECVGALEVTMFRGGTLEPAKQLRAEMGGLRLELPARRVKYGWKIYVDTSARIRSARKELDEALAAVEALGLVSIFKSQDETYPHAVHRIHTELGITRGAAINGPPRIILEMTNEGGWIPLNTPGVVVADVLDRPRKRQQLVRAQADGLAERHLFVWVDPTSTPTVATGLMGRDAVEKSAPSPGSGVVTDYWLATERRPPSLDWTHIYDGYPDLSVAEAQAAHEESGRDRIDESPFRMDLAFMETCVWHARSGQPWSRFTMLSSDVILGLYTPWYTDFLARRAEVADSDGRG